MSRGDRAVTGFLIGAILGAFVGFFAIQYCGEPIGYGEPAIKESYFRFFVVWPGYALAGAVLVAVLACFFFRDR